jgi:hypothetical protein
MEVVRPDGRRVIRRIVPMDSCIEGTCGQAFMTSKPSSALVSTSSWGLSSMDILDLMGTPPTLLPDNPWYVLQFPICGPPGSLCNSTLLTMGGYNFSSAPYLVGTLPLSVQPNPNYPSPNPNHPNVMRHWANMSQDNPVQVYIVVPATSTAATTADIFTGNLSATSAGTPTVATPYTYASWVSDITATFAKYSAIPTADIHVNVTPVYAPSTSPFDPVAAMAVYDPLPAGTAPLPAPFSGGTNTNASGHLIWDWSATPLSPNGTGPTGNGFNEVIFLQFRSLGATGLASMDLDPATGAIIECDVIFSVNAFMGGTGAILGGQFLPYETTAFVHEIGHFFGLDHTNLHPGNPPAISTVTVAGVVQPSWMNYTTSSLTTDYPGMVGIITGFSGFDMVNADIHPDDATGASRIYPVAAPVTATGKDPLINSTAEYRGYLRQPGGSLGRFGDNVYPVLRDPSASLVAAAPGNAQVPVVGTVSGTARFGSTDIVGEVDNPSGDVGSGAFRILGVPTTASLSVPYAPQYDIVAEDMQYAGFPNSSTFGEWYIIALLNPSLNSITQTQAQTRFLSMDGAATGLLPTNTSGVGGVLHPGAPYVGSFSVWPGSIVEVGIRSHGALAPNQLVVDNESRPLLGIFPRTRPSSGSVSLVAISNYPLNVASASLTVNGIPVSISSIGTLVTGLPAHIVQVDIPVTATGFLPSGSPARLRLTASELGPAPTGIIFRQGINEVQY